ncbi:hypothetical protein RIF29_36370 [Crotalaria pallida]|uniref:Uncharacterized protein n=1 Tax=Crotalaria pallida TaxID=3830 RepID=A0AAN9EC70_CROPI
MLCCVALRFVAPRRSNHEGRRTQNQNPLSLEFWFNKCFESSFDLPAPSSSSSSSSSKGVNRQVRVPITSRIRPLE